jgi:type II pantothenate kinase
MAIPETTVGIDAGATLCKVVHQEETLRTRSYSSKEIDRVCEEVARVGARRIAVTGGGAHRFADKIDGVPVRQVPEFEAWGRGAQILASRGGLDLPPRYLIVSLGTGTSILGVDGAGARRVGGTALGGGTLLGLGWLLLGVDSFEKLAELAAQGDRRPVDLLVGDIYPHGGIPLPLELTASHFAKLDSTRPTDLASAIVGLIGENVALICAALAREAGAELVLYCGSTLSDNPRLQDVLAAVTRMLGRDAHFLPDGAYCGAVGAAALAEG